MSAPTTLTKVYNALVRGLPAFFAGKLLLEANSFAVALARANDFVEAMLNELFGDTASLSIDRWERVHRVPVRPNDALQARRNRVLAVIQRVNGPQPARLEAMLTNLLNCTSAQLALVEQMRANIEAGLTLTTGAIVVSPPAVPAQPITPLLRLGAPFPGVIDDMGVRVYLSFEGITHGLGNTQILVVHPDGTSWVFGPDQYARWYENRTTFLGKPAAGMWSFFIWDPVGQSQLLEARLLVSNDQDSAQIYRYYAVRDAALVGAPDIAEAQRQFQRHALGHMASTVAEHTAAICDEAHSLCDREPMGV